MKKNLVLLLLGYCLAGHAQEKVSPAMLFLKGYGYMKGQNSPYDPDKAFALFQRSAAGDYPRAMNALGNMYQKGTGTAVNADSAVYWYKNAGTKGFEEAWLNLGRIYQEGKIVKQDFTKAAGYFEEGAKAGNANCRNMIAYFHFKGLGLRQDYAAAFAIYKDLAEKGHLNAQYFLGLCYRNGYGTPANPELAKQWLLKAAERNDKQAKHELFEEELPENKSTLTGELQARVQQLKGHQESFEAANTNNLSGYYKGYAVYYDFSGKFVSQIVPLTLQLTRNGASYTAVWKESDTVNANLQGVFRDNYFTFDSTSQYVRNNYYSHRTNERFLFNNAALNLKYLDDSMYLSGEVRFYSLKRGEPAQPMYIALSRALATTEKAGSLKLAMQLTPNPASSFVKVNFSIPTDTKVQLQLLSTSGTQLKTIPGRRLAAGTYSFTFDVTSLPAGNYIIRAQTGEKTVTVSTAQFIKQ